LSDAVTASGFEKSCVRVVRPRRARKGRLRACSGAEEARWAMERMRSSVGSLIIRVNVG